MKRMALLAAAALMVLTTVRPAAADKMALAEELMDMMNLKETLEKSHEALKRTIPMQLQQMGVAPEDAAEREKVMRMTMDLVAEEMGWDTMKDDFASVYADIMTEEELKGLIEFYKSPVGQAFLAKQPQLTARTMQITQSRMMSVMPKIQQMAREMKGK